MLVGSSLSAASTSCERSFSRSMTRYPMLLSVTFTCACSQSTEQRHRRLYLQTAMLPANVLPQIKWHLSDAGVLSCASSRTEFQCAACLQPVQQVKAHLGLDVNIEVCNDIVDVFQHSWYVLVHIENAVGPWQRWKVHLQQRCPSATEVGLSGMRCRLLLSVWGISSTAK